jgi:hypothetical protein
MEAIISVLTALTPLVGLLVGMGLVVKYVPIKWLAAIPNIIIPFLNALIAFFTAFGPAPAEAGIFGAVVAKVGFGAKVVGSVFISALASLVYETYLRPPLEKAGVKKATP